jgi:hypothetical protein
MIYYDFFKDSAEINKKEKTKPYCSKATVQNRLGGLFDRFKKVQEVKIQVL